MRPTVEDLQAIWLFTYSRSSLLDAVNFLGKLGFCQMSEVGVGVNHYGVALEIPFFLTRWNQAFRSI